MTRTITITTERIRRVIVRCLRSPAVQDATADDTEGRSGDDPAPETTRSKKKRNVMNRVIAIIVLSLIAAVPAQTQGPPFVAGLQLPTKVAFTRHRNLVVAEAGTPVNNSGRISLIDRATATRRTLVEGLPSGISRAEEPGTPAGPSGVAVVDRTVYVTIGVGDAVLPGPVPGSERPNPETASPILASLLSLESSAPLDVATGGFVLNASDHATLAGGTPITLTNGAGDELIVRLVADFPDYTAEPRGDFPENVRAGNPFGVAVLGQMLYVVDASQNLVRRVDANTGQTTTLTTFGKVANPTPVGPPFIDPVPDSIHLRGGDLIVTTLTGFPFPAGAASVLKVGIGDGIAQPLVTGLTSAIDAIPLGSGADDPMVVLEFSTNMLAQQPGRLRLVRPSGSSVTIAEGLPTPTSLAVDPVTREIFVTHIFPGFITRINAAAVLPAALPSAIVPVVASVPGGYSTSFTTSMQVSNPHPFAISGRLVVHPAGAAGSPADPSTSYSLAPFATSKIDNVIASGSGSADVLASVGAAPVIVTTIRETTSGNRLQIPTVDPADAITAGLRGTLITPDDPSSERFNIGVRTLSSGATILVRLHDSAGVEATSITRMFPPDYFQQFSFAQLLDTPAGANQAVTFELLAGAAIVYGSAVDNVTGTMSVQLAGAASD